MAKWTVMLLLFYAERLYLELNTKEELVSYDINRNSAYIFTKILIEYKLVIKLLFIHHFWKYCIQ